jgi:hypothetical protein
VFNRAHGGEGKVVLAESADPRLGLDHLGAARTLLRLPGGKLFLFGDPRVGLEKDRGRERDDRQEGSCDEPENRIAAHAALVGDLGRDRAEEDADDESHDHVISREFHNRLRAQPVCHGRRGSYTPVGGHRGVRPRAVTPASQDGDNFAAEVERTSTQAHGWIDWAGIFLLGAAGHVNTNSMAGTAGSQVVYDAHRRN